MHFILIAHDKPDSLPVRHAARAAHLDYWRGFGPALRFGGPLLGADHQPFGSVLVVEAPDEAAARAIFEADPYAAADLFELTTISAFRPVFDKGEVVA